MLRVWYSHNFGKEWPEFKNNFWTRFYMQECHEQQAGEMHRTEAGRSGHLLSYIPRKICRKMLWNGPFEMQLYLTVTHRADAFGLLSSIITSSA
jgi:hypothetical protein